MPQDFNQFYDTAREDRAGEMSSEYLQQWDGHQYYLLDPRIFAATMRRDVLKGQLAQRCLRGILGLLQLRRTAASTVKVFKKPVRIGDSIPMYRISTVELTMSSTEQRAYREVWDMLSPWLYYKLQQLKAGEAVEPAAGQREGFRDNRTHRHLSLCIFNVRAYQLLSR